jgi:hypothetical protein
MKWRTLKKSSTFGMMSDSYIPKLGGWNMPEAQKYTWWGRSCHVCFGFWLVFHLYLDEKPEIDSEYKRTGFLCFLLCHFLPRGITFWSVWTTMTSPFADAEILMVHPMLVVSIRFDTCLESWRHVSKLVGGLEHVICSPIVGMMIQPD